MVLDPIPQSLPVHFFGSRPQPPTSHPKYEQIISQRETPCVGTMSYISQTQSSRRTYERFVSHIQIIYVSNMHQSNLRVSQRVSATWVMSHKHNLHVAHMNESCLTYKQPMSQICISQISQQDNVCRQHEYRAVSATWWTPCHVRVSRVSHLNESCFIYDGPCPTYEWVMSYIWMRHVPLMNESCVLHMGQVCRQHERGCVFTTRDTLSRADESCLTYEWVRVLSHIWTIHDPRMHESRHTYEWVMSHIWMSHVTHMNELCHTHERVLSHTWTIHDPHMHESHLRVRPCVGNITIGLRLVGPLKL